MNEPTKQKARGVADGERLLPYAFAAVGLLLILTLAILTPDYMNWRYRMAALQGNQAIVHGTNTSVQSNIIGTNQIPGTGPQDVPLKTSDIYETYGKLMTMLLGFVSVIGILFGYFVRKSVRELTEDVRADVQREVDLFSRARDLALKEAESAKNAANATLAEAQKLETRLKELTTSVESRLSALDEAIKSYQDKRQTPSQTPTETTAKVDQALKEAGL